MDDGTGGMRLLGATYGARFAWFRLALGRARRAGGRADVVRIDPEPVR